MSSGQYSDLFMLGVRPPNVQYLILYYSQLKAGIQACFTWSSDSVDRVRELFQSDYYEHRPRISMIMPTDQN
jgi:hypothetical protein